MKYLSLLLLCLIACGAAFPATVEVGATPTREFGTCGTDGVGVDADELPTGYVTENGSSVASLTITDVGTGQYKAVYTVPAQDEGDILTVWVSIVMGGTTYVTVLDRDEVTAKRVSDLNDATQLVQRSEPDNTTIGAISTTIGVAGAGLTALAPASTALSSAVWTGTKAGYIDAAISTRSDGTGVTLHADYNAAKTAATQTSVDTVDEIVDSILEDTAGLNFTGTDVKATLDGETVTASSVTDKTGYTASTVSDKTGYSLAVTPPTASENATAVWATETRTLSSFGTLVADAASAVWASVSRTITAGALDAAYNPAKTAAQAGDAMTLTAAYDAAKTAAPASTALSTATWTAEKAGFLDTAISSVGGGTAPTVEEIRTEMESEDGLLYGINEQIGSVGGVAGPGATLCTLPEFQNEDGSPAADVQVWLSNDASGDHVVAGTRVTNSGGLVQFLLDVGSTYYIWAQKDGKVEVQGQAWVAVETGE